MHPIQSLFPLYGQVFFYNRLYVSIFLGWTNGVAAGISFGGIPWGAGAWTAQDRVEAPVERLSGWDDWRGANQEHTNINKSLLCFTSSLASFESKYEDYIFRLATVNNMR